MGNIYYYNLIKVYINYAIGKVFTYNRLGPVEVFYNFKRIIKRIIRGTIGGTIKGAIRSVINNIIKGIINNNYGR